MDRDYDGLATLTSAVLDAKLAELRRLGAEIADLRLQIGRLRLRRNHAGQTGPAGATDPHTEIVPALVPKWHIWCDREIARLNVEIAERSAARERLILEARVAFGRNQAVGELAEQERRLARQKMARRRSTA